MTMLFSPYSLGPLELSNRITIAPMCQYHIRGHGRRAGRPHLAK
jgi:2,4-dienoyl-CoA reductase-like NADH-dependent reductase (Old Yellow Enzyme family)